METVTNDPLDRLADMETEEQWLGIFRGLSDRDQTLLAAVYQKQLGDLALHWHQDVPSLSRRADALVQQIRAESGSPGTAPRPNTRTAVLIPVDGLSVSPFNPRKWRSPERIQTIADSIRRHGFDPSRALKVYPTQEGLEIFAGATRWEAARLLGLRELPCYVYDQMSPVDLTREADLDNEFDASHEPVSVVDLWENLYWLSVGEGWTHLKIAQIKGLGRTLVSERIKWWRMATPHLKEVLRQGAMCESHVRWILSVVISPAMEGWWSQEELTDAITDYCLENNSSTTACKYKVRQLRSTIAAAESIMESLDEELHSVFLHRLNEANAQTPGDVEAIAQSVGELPPLPLEVLRTSLIEQEGAARETAAGVLLRESVRRCFAYGNFLEGKHLPPSWNLWLGVAPDLDPEEWAIAGDLLLPTAEPGAIVFLACKNWSRYDRILRGLSDAVVIREPWILSHEPQPSRDPFRHPLPSYSVLLYGTVADGRLGMPTPNLLPVEWRTEDLPQSFLSRLVEVGSTPGQRVIDPFAGTGGTLVAAKMQNRDYWGCESDGDRYAQGLQSLIDLAQPKTPGSTPLPFGLET